MQLNSSPVSTATFGSLFGARAYLQQDGAKRVTGAAATLSQMILSAASTDELRDALDAAADSEAFEEYWAAVRDWLAVTDLADLQLSPSLRILQRRTHVFGVAIASRLTRIDGVWLDAGSVIGSPSEVWERGQSVPALGMIDDPKVPLEIRKLCLAICHGILASLVINHVMSQGTSSPAMGALVDVAESGAKAALSIIRGQFGDLSKHAKRETWIMKAFAKAADGDGYFAPSSAE